MKAIPTKKTVERSPSGSAHEIRLKRILVPTDFSEGAEHALDYAVRLSRLFHAEILILHVFHLQEYLALLSKKAEVDSKTANKVLEAAKRRIVDKLEDIARRLADKETIIIPSLYVGVPFEEIVKCAAERDVDLIVMSTHGRTGLAHFLLGSTTERVISHAACPVYVVKQAQDGAKRRSRKRLQA